MSVDDRQVTGDRRSTGNAVEPAAEPLPNAAKPLFAQQIDAGLITGSTFKTAKEGQRVEISVNQVGYVALYTGQEPSNGGAGTVSVAVFSGQPQISMNSPSFGTATAGVHLTSRAADNTGDATVSLVSDIVTIGGWTGIGPSAPKLRIKQFTGTLDASGDATIAHGITNAHLKAVGCWGFFKGGSGQAESGGSGNNMTVDGTNITARFGAAGANAKYRVTFVYMRDDDNW